MMNDTKNTLDKINDAYFSQPFEKRTQETVADYLSKVLFIVQLNPESFDDFEEINLKTQQAVNVPISSKAYEFLRSVQEELLGYEDLELVLGNKRKESDAIKEWCSYIEVVVSKIKAKDFSIM